MRLLFVLWMLALTGLVSEAQPLDQIDIRVVDGTTGHTVSDAVVSVDARPGGSDSFTVRVAAAGYEPRAIDVNFSFWDNGLERIDHLAEGSTVIPGDRRETRDPFRSLTGKRSGMDPGSARRSAWDDARLFLRSRVSGDRHSFATA